MQNLWPAAFPEKLCSQVTVAVTLSLQLGAGYCSRRPAVETSEQQHERIAALPGLSVWSCRLGDRHRHLLGDSRCHFDRVPRCVPRIERPRFPSNCSHYYLTIEQTRPSSSGSSRATRTRTATQNASSGATTTSSRTSSSLPTASSRSPRPGTTPSASGTLTPVSPRAASLATHPTFSPSASVPTTGRLSRVRATGRSSSGTRLGSANMISKRMVTQSGACYYAVYGALDLTRVCMKGILRALQPECHEPCDCLVRVG